MTRTELTNRLDGVFVPLFTPFMIQDGASVNEEQLRANVRYLIGRGVRILNPAGTTGEFWTLTPGEHHLVLRAVIEEAHAACPDAVVVAGATGPNVAATVKLAQFASECGAPIVLIAPTYYLPLGEEDLVNYYKTVSQSVDVAIMVYDIPVATGVRLQGDIIARICEECPNVVALKTALPADAPRDFERLMRQFGQRLAVFSGMGAYFSTFTYMTGIAGITDTLGNAVPDFGLTLHRLARARRWEEMNNLYQDAFDVLEIEQLYGKAGLKEIANYSGRKVGPTRYPMTDTLSLEDREDIEHRLSAWSYTRELLVKESRMATA